MDKFLVDLDSVLDKLEAEDADRCATDKLDDEDEPCNLIGSSVYRNCDNESINKKIDGTGGCSSSSIGKSNYYSSTNYSHQLTDSVIDRDKVMDSLNDDDTDGGSCRNELDSFLSIKPTSSNKLMVHNDPGSFGSVLISSVGKNESYKTLNQSLSVNEPNVPNLMVKDEPDIGLTISDIEGGAIGDANTVNDGITRDSTNCVNLDDNDGNKADDEGHKLTESSTSYQFDNNTIQQSVNLVENYTRSESMKKNFNEKTFTESSGLINGSYCTSKSESITQLNDKSSVNQVITFDHEHRNQQSSSSSSSGSSKSNILLDNSKGIDLGESKDEESDGDMTEEEVKALEKELESELKRLNTESSEVQTLEDIIESESKTIMSMDTPSSVNLISPLSPSKSSSPITTTTSTSTTETTSSSTLSPSSPSTSTSSSSLIISKPIEQTSIAVSESSLINQPSESHESTLSNEFREENETKMMVHNESDQIVSSIEIAENSIDTNPSSTITNKPIRPATLPLNGNQQSNQPGHTPMHGDDEPINVSSSYPDETETESEVTSSSTNNQMDRDIVPENVQSSMSSIGYFKPFWIPDEDAPQCMICDVKFTVMKRRHHCRACGKVLCAQCSSFKAPLAYLSYEKARVCDHCFPHLCEGGNISGQDNSFTDSGYYQAGHPLGAEGLPSPSAPPSHQLSSSSTTSSLVTGATVSSSSSSVVQPVSVLRRSSKPRTGEPKQVIFSDGIRPGNDLKDDQVTSMSHRRHAKKVKSPPADKNSPGFPSSSSSSSKPRLSKRIIIHDANGQLPPIVNASALHLDPTFDNLITLLEKEDEPPVKFSLTKNLSALVKLVKLDCCTNELCWSFTSQNLSTVGQDEVIVVVEKSTGESCLPRDIFRLFAYIYDSASKGYPFSELSHVLYPDGFFGLKDFPSFLFIRPTFQCLNKLTLPPAPFLIGVLIHRFEVPWAKLFPLRLVLRLGSKYRCYPCPIVSYRSRRPSYFEIGHTVMDILADFRNFQYTLPVIPGLTIHSEAKRTTVTFPKNRYDKVMKALGSSNEYVLSFGGTFSLTADSHLTCVQNDDGQYHTETIRLNEDETSEPKITGASFIVFSGALKSSTGLMAKMSVVEDGLLVQVTANTLNSLKSSLKEMNDFTIECGKKDAPTNEESVSLIWGEDDKQFNLGVRSCIDGISLEGVNSIRMFSGTDFEGDKYLIRWVELFLIQNTELPRSSDGYDAGRAAEIIAQSFCPALVPCLESLVESKITKIGLRVTLDPDKVGYDVGSNGVPLPPNYVNRLDAALIPIIMGNIAPNMEVRLVIELIFYILIK